MISLTKKNMSLNEYQELTEGTANFDKRKMNEFLELDIFDKNGKENLHTDNFSKLCSYVDLTYVTLGLAGEAAEIANKVKKINRDDNFEITEDRKEQIRGEIGDVLWYLAVLAKKMGISLEEVAQKNLLKLYGRKERGTIRGDGDNR